MTTTTRRISQSITPTPEDISTLRGLFITKGASDPVITELRNYLKGSVPSWVPKMSPTQSLTTELLNEIQEAAEKRRAVIEGFPEGAKRNNALSDIENALKLVQEMQNDLSGAQTFGAVS